MIRSSKYHVLTVTVIVSFIAIIGKLIGFLREAVIAAFFGATSATDAFFFAQSMPAMIFPAVCSSISTAFITMYVTKLTQEGRKKEESLLHILWRLHFSRHPSKSSCSPVDTLYHCIISTGIQR